MAYQNLGTPPVITATTNTDLYTVAGGKAAVGSTLVICNQNTTPITYRVAVRKAGATLTTAMYLVFDASLPAKGSDFLTVGLALAATDVVTVWASATLVSFNLFGDES